MKKKNSGCSTGLWVLFMTACITATMVLGILKAVGALETTWLMAFLPLIIGAGTPVVLLGITAMIAVLVDAVRKANDND